MLQHVDFETSWGFFNHEKLFLKQIKFLSVDSDESKILVHDRTNFLVGRVPKADFPLASGPNDGEHNCPVMTNLWTEADTDGYIENRYISLQCFYPNLMSSRSYDRMLTVSKSKP